MSGDVLDDVVPLRVVVSAAYEPGRQAGRAESRYLRSLTPQLASCARRNRAAREK